MGGGDVAYSKNENRLFGAIVVLSFPDMEILDMATADEKIPFPYIPNLLSFREGPILIKTFQKLKIKADVMIYDGQGIAHPRGMALASHMGLWFDLPSIGCAKTPLLDEPCCCIKVRLNQLHTTIKRRFTLLCRRPRGPHGPEGLYFSKVTIWVIQWITLI